MLNDVPLWLKIWFVICLGVGVSVAIWTFKECGPKALLFGNNATTIAALGMCEE